MKQPPFLNGIASLERTTRSRYSKRSATPCGWCARCLFVGAQVCVNGPDAVTPWRPAILILKRSEPWMHSPELRMRGEDAPRALDHQPRA
jgi:hypothetical protein